MNFLSLVFSTQLIETFKIAIHANAGIALGVHARVEPWKNKFGDGFVADLALGFVQLKIVVDANK
jgi:hypothetical protein